MSKDLSTLNLASFVEVRVVVVIRRTSSAVAGPDQVLTSTREIIQWYDLNMSGRKARVTVTLDRALVEAANAAVAAGRADSVSAWVTLALAELVAKERRLSALSSLIADYEAEHGAITAEELAFREREDRRKAIVVRGVARVPARKRRGKAA